jgi:hypothetical protein
MTIEERFENMERELGRVKRRHRWLSGAILLVAGGLVVPIVFEATAFRAGAQATGPVKEIHANKFVLEDKKGKVCGQLTVDRDGPVLSLANEKGIAELGIIKGNPSLGLWDEKKKLRTRLTVFEGHSSLSLLDATGMARFLAGAIKIETSEGTTSYPESSLILFGPDGKIIWSAIK